MADKKWYKDETRGPVFAGLDTIGYSREVTDPDKWYEPLDDIVKAHEEGGLELAFAEACRVIYQLCYTAQELQTQIESLERRYKRHTHREELVVKDSR